MTSYGFNSGKVTFTPALGEMITLDYGMLGNVIAAMKDVDFTVTTDNGVVIAGCSGGIVLDSPVSAVFIDEKDLPFLEAIIRAALEAFEMEEGGGFHQYEDHGDVNDYGATEPDDVNDREATIRLVTEPEFGRYPLSSYPIPHVPEVVLRKDHSETMHLPDDAAERKDLPLATGFLDYFPDAVVAVAALSKKGNDQHNPGQPLFWNRGKSGDESDALLRHFLDRGKVDTDGVRHSVKVAWRALALLQKEIEAERKGK